jgi:TolB-like protein/tetratricopeptide (TPR) repeat protein
VIIQVAQTTFPALLLPDWSVTLVVILLVLGFPLAVVLAWAYQVEADSSAHTATSVQIVLDKSRKLDFVVISVLTAVVIVLSYLLYVRVSDPATELAEESSPVAATSPPAVVVRPSIGVLPFVNLSSDPENKYFADGLAEEILNVLVRTKAFDVAARTSSFYFKDKDVDISMVAERLGVTTILEGSVRRQGEQIRVTAQLIEAETGFHLWSETYNRQLEDIFSIQDDIARQVANGLNVVLSSESSGTLERIPTESVAAYQFYLQGRDHLRDERTESRLQRAVALFDSAIEIDGNYAEAYAGRCDALLALYEHSRATDYFEQAERACHRGLTLDADAGGVYTALGHLYRLSGQYDKAVAEYQQAISMDRRNVDAYSGLAQTFSRQGRPADAEKTYREAIDVQPGYWRGHLSLGNFLFEMGRFDEAVRSYSFVVDVAPDNATGYLNLGTSYFMLRDLENATTAWQKSIELEPRASTYLNLGNSYFFLRRFADAAEMYALAIELAPDDFETWGALGDAYLHTDDRQALAVPAYEKAIELGEKQLEINTSNHGVMATLAQYYSNTGQAGRAEELLAKATEGASDDMYVHYSIAVANASLGNTTPAALAAKKAVELGYPADLLVLDAGLASILDEEILQGILPETD